MDYAKTTVDTQERWKELAQKLTLEYKDICKQESQIELAEKEFNNTHDQSLFDQNCATDRTNQLDNVSTVLKRIEDHHTNSKEMRNIIGDISKGHDSRVKLFKEDITKQNCKSLEKFACLQQ